MASAVLDCPHCAAKSLAMNLTGMITPPAHVTSPSGQRPFIPSLAVCTRCWGGIAIELVPAQKGEMSREGLSTASIELFHGATGTPEAKKLKAVIVRPPSENAEIPPHLPQSVAKAFRQGETNFRLPDAEEAAALMYRRSLELAVKEVFPDEKGTLIQRIDKLASKGFLPDAMKDWAHEIRVIGNDGAHELDGVERADLVAAQGFTDAFLRYLISLPQEVKLRRAQVTVEASE